MQLGEEESKDRPGQKPKKQPKRGNDKGDGSSSDGSASCSSFEMNQPQASADNAFA